MEEKRDGEVYGVSRYAHEVSYRDSAGRDITLYGEIYAPACGGRRPAVILCHGFNGHHTDFELECRKLAGRGFVSYDFDFCGAQSGGRSVGRGEKEYTPLTMSEDLKAAVYDISALENVDGTQMFLFGGSQGGFVVGITAADADIRERISAVAMYYPAFNIPDDWRRAPVRDTPLMGYSIGEAYIREVQGIHPFEVIGEYKKDVSIVWGDRDALVAKGYIDGAVAAYGKDRTELTVIHGAGHGFSGADLEFAAETVVSFFEAHTHAAE